MAIQHIIDVKTKNLGVLKLEESYLHQSREW
ncbi:hypothetical protein M973_06795 [Francisella orientalis LADL 07-285A]|nr:hypothetical protein M973_06795 [Francisella orientalis LADL 07-285A]